MQITILEEDLDKSIKKREEIVKLIENNHKLEFADYYSCNCLLATALTRILGKITAVSWFDIESIKIGNLPSKVKDEIVLAFDLKNYNNIRNILPYTCEIDI